MEPGMLPRTVTAGCAFKISVLLSMLAMLIGLQLKQLLCTMQPFDGDESRQVHSGIYAAASWIAARFTQLALV